MLVVALFDNSEDNGPIAAYNTLNLGSSWLNPYHSLKPGICPWHGEGHCFEKKDVQTKFTMYKSVTGPTV
jgi:hypothetical protein